MNNIFDSHAHYTDTAFSDDCRELLGSLPDKGVKYIMLASTSVEDSQASSALSREYGFIFSAAGVHPECIDDNPSDYISLLRNIIADNPKIRAIGEIGLDYHYDGYDREKQIQLFREQLALADELSMPVIVHSRNATEDTMTLLREYRPKGVVHCFSGSAETAAEVISLGMYIGFTGVITFKNAKKALKALAAVPDDRLLLETDCPYMAPEPFRGKRCDSSLIRFTAEKAAEVRGMDAQKLLDITCSNAMTLFGINDR